MQSRSRETGTRWNVPGLLSRLKPTQGSTRMHLSKRHTCAQGKSPPLVLSTLTCLVKVEAFARKDSILFSLLFLLPVPRSVVSCRELQYVVRKRQFGYLCKRNGRRKRKGRYIDSADFRESGKYNFHNQYLSTTPLARRALAGAKRVAL